jgi:hypothetical protein
VKKADRMGKEPQRDGAGFDAGEKAGKTVKE